jgi:nicotinamidase-related amidase
MKKTALLVIDGQNDFVLPTGALPVAGAVADMDRVVQLIQKHGDKIDSIHCTMDSHRTIDISHPCWWSTRDGSLVQPFTPISHKDLVEGKYTANFNPQWSHDYVKRLEEQGEFQHFIWPYHCLIGSVGAAFYEPLHKSVNAWEIFKRQTVNYVTKGDNAYTEHFGALRANIEIPQDPRTQFNQKLIDVLMKHDDILLTGEAKSHCVANTLRQAVNEAPGLAAKIIVLEDCMSDVTELPQEFYDSVRVIYDDAKSKGVRFAKSTDVFSTQTA